MDSTICLTCLSKPCEAHNLNEIILENLKIVEILQQLVPQFWEQKEFTLPDTICAKCLEKLVISFKFQKQCLYSVKNLYKFWSKNTLDKKSPQKVPPTKSEDDNVALKSSASKSADESTVDSLPEIKEDLKMPCDEMEIDPLSANKDLGAIFWLDDTKNEEKCKKNAEDSVNNNLQCKKNRIKELNRTLLLKLFNSYKNLQEKTRSESVGEPSFLSNQCKLCNKIFKQSQGLASHMSKTHFKKHLYQCKKCSKGFSVEELFVRHCNLHLGIKPFPCTQCDKAFDTKGTLNQHMLCHSKESSYKCTICGKTFYRLDVYKQHMQRHDDREVFQCLKCAKSFKCFSDHIKHIQTHKSEMSFDDDSEEISMHSANENKIIEMPLEQILTEFKLKNKDDTGLSVVEKIEDGKKFKLEKNEGGTEIDFTIDQKTNSDNIKDQENNDSTTSTESSQCNLCKQIFKNAQGLARHRSSTHFKKHLYQCDQCDRGFSVEEFYIKHRNRHLGIKTFKCKQCDKAFETNSILNQHLISHSKLTPHLCTTCGKSFRRLDGLRQHMLRHGDERPFKCSFCAKSFKCHSDKLKHTLKHDEKRYECNICGSRLATPESLSQHKMTHTGEKPFKCSYCDKSFISLSNMRCHERIHTGEKPYKCQYCWKSFRQSNDRKKHTKRVHKNEQNEINLEENV